MKQHQTRTCDTAAKNTAPNVCNNVWMVQLLHNFHFFLKLGLNFQHHMRGHVAGHDLLHSHLPAQQLAFVHLPERAPSHHFPDYHGTHVKRERTRTGGVISLKRSDSGRERRG